MAKSFTEIQKSNIRENLILGCETSWSKYGYKKTNIEELCLKAGISKGAFYLFFDSKEDLFCDVLDYAQNQLVLLIRKILSETPTKDGFAKMLKLLYREYDKNKFLHDLSSPDFMAFVNKLPKERISKHKITSVMIFREMIEKANLKLIIREEKACAVISTLLSIVSLEGKERLGCGPFEVIDFLIDNTIEKIFE